MVNTLKTLAILIGLVGFTVSHPLYGSDWQKRAHLKYRLSSLHYPDNSALKSTNSRVVPLHSFDLRAGTTYQKNGWETELDAEIVALGGRGARASNTLFADQSSQIGEGALPNDRRRALRLSKELISDHEFLLTTRIDRASVAYLAESSTFRVGRQALTLGNGLAFNVFDLVNPFSPFDIDQEYKTGDDLAYAQFTSSPGDSLEVAVVPRRDLESGDISEDQSTALMMVQTQSEILDARLSFVAARHYADWLLGTGFNRPLFEGILRADLRLVRSDLDDSYYTSAIVNFDRSWFVFERNLYGFIEYYRNGYGLEKINLNSIQQDLQLLNQLERGESFIFGRDLLTIGTRFELHPLVNLHLATVANLNDRSFFYQKRVEFDIVQDLILSVGINIASGRSNTEFGGIKLPQGGNTRSPLELYARIAWYL